VISLEKAVEQIQETLKKARSKDAADKMGLLPAKATVTFVMAADESTSSTTGATIGVALPMGLTVGATNSDAITSKENHSNTIVLEFNNALLAPLESVLGQIGHEAKWKSVKEATEQTRPEDATPGN
jgi:hypothetical protein